MAEDRAHHAASTAAPPPGKEGIGIAHAAATSVGAGSSSGPGGASSTEEVYDAEEECEPCPKAPRDHHNASRKAAGEGGGAVGGLDGPLRAERGSPYARPRREGKSFHVVPRRLFFSFVVAVGMDRKH